MAPKRAPVTGASGSTGSEAVALFDERGWKVRAPVSGGISSLGGGHDKSISVLEAIERLEDLMDR
jgi:hypothetical protein